ncbi:hypothetical protein O181_082878 [Austropuccinia psidii MF-1]|uniref:Uncharacterized protein n=1 Tax=Austropuccinia psidii MF-1 TaxID=1389203 RepID=A0A9Q3FSM7_9BASI|nr:hypothetical protein [Austropuccinia psidii MF-1]
MPLYSSSEVPISRINNQGIVERIRRILNFPINPSGEGINELDGEEIEVLDKKLAKVRIPLLLINILEPSKVKLYPVLQEVANPYFLLPLTLSTNSDPIYPLRGHLP